VKETGAGAGFIGSHVVDAYIAGLTRSSLWGLEVEVTRT
jgi:nucleoside-diphosphate-sugar epimerase